MHLELDASLDKVCLSHYYFRPRFCKVQSVYHFLKKFSKKLSNLTTFTNRKLFPEVYSCWTFLFSDIDAIPLPAETSWWVSPSGYCGISCASKHILKSRIHDSRRNRHIYIFFVVFKRDCTKSLNCLLVLILANLAYDAKGNARHW